MEPPQDVVAASAARCDEAITPTPGAHNSDPVDRAAYSTAMIDRAISAREESGVVGVLHDRMLRRVLLVAVVVQLLDAFTTAAGLHLGLSERNPVTVSILRAYGSAGLLLQKLMVDCLLIIAMTKLPRRVAAVSVGMVTLVTAVVVGANLAGLVSAAW